MIISPITVPTTVRRVSQLSPSKIECILERLELKFLITHTIRSAIIHNLM